MSPIRRLPLLHGLMLALCFAELGRGEDYPRLELDPATGRVSVKGEVGGEQHNGYSVQLPGGRVVRISLTARGGRAGISVRDTSDFFEGAPVRFGTRSNHNRTWQGRMPKAGVYYIYITAYPEAVYTLSVELK